MIQGIFEEQPDYCSPQRYLQTGSLSFMEI